MKSEYPPALPRLNHKLIHSKTIWFVLPGLGLSKNSYKDPSTKSCCAGLGFISELQLVGWNFLKFLCLSNHWTVFPISCWFESKFAKAYQVKRVKQFCYFLFKLNIEISCNTVLAAGQKTRQKCYLKSNLCQLTNIKYEIEDELQGTIKLLYIQNYTENGICKI